MVICTPEEISRAIRRLSLQAVEKSRDIRSAVLVGIRTRGVVLARRMHDEILKSEGLSLPVGILDISLYRDDLLTGDCDAVFKGSEIGFDLDGKDVILCDDVLFTGRTVRAALAALTGMGRASAVRLYCLIDRGHRELPYAAEGVGKNIPTSRFERVRVLFRETDGEDAVYLEKQTV